MDLRLDHNDWWVVPEQTLGGLHGLIYRRHHGPMWNGDIRCGEQFAGLILVNLHANYVLLGQFVKR